MLAWLLCNFSGDPDQYCNFNSIFCDFKWRSGPPPPPPLDPPMVLTLFQTANTEIDTQTVTRSYAPPTRITRDSTVVVKHAAGLQRRPPPGRPRPLFPFLQEPEYTRQLCLLVVGPKRLQGLQVVVVVVLHPLAMELIVCTVE